MDKSTEAKSSTFSYVADKKLEEMIREIEKVFGPVEIIGDKNGIKSLPADKSSDS